MWVARKFRVMVALPSIGIAPLNAPEIFAVVVIVVQFWDEKKRRAVLSNYNTDVYETWQLWLVLVFDL